MAKSEELYILCSICGGVGVAQDDALNAISLSDRCKVCIGCYGARYTPLGLNKSQVDAALRKAGEYDKFMADFANDGSKPRTAKITDVPLHYLHRADSSDYEHLSNRPDQRKQDRAKYDDNEDGA